MKIRTHDIVLHKLGTLIVTGKIKPMENLPAEAELCSKYKIGRNTLREVFKVLSAKGILQASPRKGTWVKDMADWDLFDPDVLKWAVGTPLNLKILADVNEARSLIEPSAARLASRNAKISDVAVIENAYDRMVKSSPMTDMACIADVDFHVAVFNASHNKLWIKFGQILSVTLTQLFKENVTRERYKNALPLHSKVLNAIRLKDEVSAEKYMRELTQYAIGTFKIIREKKTETLEKI